MCVRMYEWMTCVANGVGTASPRARREALDRGRPGEMEARIAAARLRMAPRVGMCAVCSGHVTSRVGMCAVSRVGMWAVCSGHVTSRVGMCAVGSGHVTPSHLL